MIKRIHLGLVLHSMPSTSETFMNNKIKGLLNNHFKLTVFISKGQINYHTHRNLKIRKQINVKNKSVVIYKFLKLIIMKPFLILKFIKLELGSGRSPSRILKNIIIHLNML